MVVVKFLSNLKGGLDMSKRSKLILATALFGAALFGASCGGGGGGGTTAGTGTGSGSGGSGSGGGSGSPPSPPPPPPASVEGKVLAVLTTGVATAGSVNPVAICELKSDNKAYCGNDLNPSENAVLNYVHEFPNGNVVLAGSGDVLYFYNASSNTLTKLTTSRDLNGNPNPIPTGITIPAGDLHTVVRFHATPNFVMIYNGNDLVAISNIGNVIRDNTVANINLACETAVKGSFTYTLNVNGTTTSTTSPSPTVVAQAGGKFLVTVPVGAGTDVYLSDSRCGLVNSVLIMGAVNNFADAKMVEFGGNYYIAIRYGAAGRNLDYYRVTGTTRTQLYFVAANVLNAANSNLYSIDGRGYLYFNLANGAPANTCTGTAGAAQNDNICVISPTGGALLSNNITGAAGNTINGILAFNDRALVRTNNAVYDVSINAGGGLATAPNPPGADGTALDRCIDNANTRAVDGRGTPVVRCVFDQNAASGLQDRLSVFVHNGNGSYSSASVRINNNSTNGLAADTIGQNNVRFGANAVLVVTRDNTGALNPINLCTITTTPVFNVSCSATDIPNPVGNMPIRDTTRIYPTTALLKFNGNNVFYLSGTSPRVGNIFGTPQSLTTGVAGATGGNATFDLTKFAFSFRPVDAPPGCNTQVAFFSSLTAGPKFYTLSTANTCVDRILKVFP
jgi:hypothetical protein